MIDVTVQPAPTNTLQEVSVAAHFRAPWPVGVMELADLVRHFSDYPIVQQLPRLQPATLPQFGKPQMAFEVNVASADLPRILLRSPDLRHTIQLQGDRLVVGWSRIEPLGAPAAYPGFDAMLVKWTGILSRFETWTDGHFSWRPEHRLGEVSYANVAPLERDGQQKRISDIFSFSQIGGRALDMMSMNWTERLYSDEESAVRPKGMVVASVGLGQAPPAIPVLAFNFAGVASVANNQQTERILSEIHTRIREIYQSTVVQDAH